jgi:hypothetical protein
MKVTARRAQTYSSSLVAVHVRTGDLADERECVGEHRSALRLSTGPTPGWALPAKASRSNCTTPSDPSSRLMMLDAHPADRVGMAKRGSWWAADAAASGSVFPFGTAS